MFFREQYDFQAKRLHKKLCTELRISEVDPNSQTLKDIIDSYLKNNGDSSIMDNDFERSVALSYLNHTIEQQAASISKDMNNPLQDTTNPDQIIKDYFKKILLYLYNDKDKKFNDEHIKKIFTEKELPTALYVVNSCPLISKDDKGNYNFTSKTLLDRWEAEAFVDDSTSSKVTFDEEAQERLNKMLGRK